MKFVLLDNTHFKRKQSHKIERSLNCTEWKSALTKLRFPPGVSIAIVLKDIYCLTIQMTIEQLNVHMCTIWIFNCLKAKTRLKYTNKSSVFREKIPQGVEVLLVCLNS